MSRLTSGLLLIARCVAEMKPEPIIVEKIVHIQLESPGIEPEKEEPHLADCSQLHPLLWTVSFNPFYDMPEATLLPEATLMRVWTHELIILPGYGHCW